MRTRLLCLCVIFMLCTTAAMAADAAKGAKEPSAPVADKANTAAQQPSTAPTPPPGADKTPPKAPATKVGVDHEGSDLLGVKLSLLMKEQFNSSSLFVLSDKEEPKIRLLLSTASEFPSRPGVGSTYTAVWVFYESPKSFESYLARETGIITPETVAELATRLAERTSGITASYAYLFKRESQ